MCLKGNAGRLEPSLWVSLGVDTEPHLKHLSKWQSCPTWVAAYHLHCLVEPHSCWPPIGWIPSYAHFFFIFGAVERRKFMHVLWGHIKIISRVKERHHNAFLWSTQKLAIILVHSCGITPSIAIMIERSIHDNISTHTCYTWWNIYFIFVGFSFWQVLEVFLFPLVQRQT